jgi:hypothetical protein
MLQMKFSSLLPIRQLEEMENQKQHLKFLEFLSQHHCLQYNH